MSFFRSAVFLSALCRIVRGNGDGGDLDSSAVFHLPADFRERLAGNDINSILSKDGDGNFREVLTFGKGIDSDGTSTPEPFDSWSILWYFASFSGLIVFFLVVSCSEWCCRKHIRRSNSSQQTASTPPSPTGSNIPEAPPPAYDLFAPPSYESLTSTSNQRNKEKSEYDVYVVPVHAIGSVLGAGASEVPEDAPPSYSAINMNFLPDPGMEELRIGGYFGAPKISRESENPPSGSLNQNSTITNYISNEFTEETSSGDARDVIAARDLETVVNTQSPQQNLRTGESTT